MLWLSLTWSCPTSVAVFSFIIRPNALFYIQCIISNITYNMQCIYILYHYLERYINLYH